MSTTAGDYPLHDSLKQFLSSPDAQYPPVTVRLVSLSPAQLTQDDESYLEAVSLSKDLLKDSRLVKADLARSKVLLRLADWKLVFNRTPNTADHRLDIDVKTFEVLPIAQAKGSEVLTRKLLNILETNPYNRLYEDALRKVSKRKDNTELTGLHMGRGILQHGTEHKGDNGSNQNKYSFRQRYANPNIITPKDSATNEDQTVRKGDGEGLRGNTPGIRVSGINGKQNMRKLKDFKKSYTTASQESITNQIMGPDRLEVGPLNGHKKDESPIKNKERSIYLGKRPMEEDETTRNKTSPINDDTHTKFLPVQERSRQGTPRGVLEEAPTHKKPKVPQRSEFQMGEPGDEGLNYDELMDCLSLERGLVHWEDLIFSKDVVKYLKHHFSDLLDKK
jgi:hypothetical protein